MNAGILADEGEARTQLKALAVQEVKLRRPVVILAGLGDVGLHAGRCRGELRKYIDSGEIVVVTFFGIDDLRRCAVKVIQRTHTSFEGSVEGETAEVDVIGISMGGVVARLAAEDEGVLKLAGRRLKVRRLYTMASPLQGAKLAALPALSRVHTQLRKDSEVIVGLNRQEPPYEVVSYARRGDGVVGEANAALPGREALVVDAPGIEGAHWGVITDPRVVLDLVRRLGE